MNVAKVFQKSAYLRILLNEKSDKLAIKIRFVHILHTILRVCIDKIVVVW